MNQPVRSTLVVALVLAAATLCGGWPVAAQSPLAPTHRDIAYAAAHPAQKLDVYLAKSEQPTAAMIYIHGGGWRGGSKARIPAWLEDAVREGWLSVVSVEYRFSDVAPHPAQVNDCLRAIQFVRANADKWNLDPERIGVTGGSAGGHLSLWVALHDDAADPKAADPVSRQSSRVACAVSFAGPTDFSLLKEIEHRHPAYRLLLGYEPETPAEKMDAEALRHVSPISFASQDDPPVLQVHGDRDDIVPIEHAQKLDQRLKSLGAKSELVVVPDGSHGVAGATPQVSERAGAFVRELLKR